MVDAQHDRDDVLGLARAALPDRDVRRERRRAGQRHVDAADVGDDARERVRDLGLTDEPEGRDVVASAPRSDRLEPGPLPHRERLRDEDVLRRAARDVAGELAEGPLGLAHARQDLPLDDDLRRGGHQEVGRQARRGLARLAEEAAADLDLPAAGGRGGSGRGAGCGASWIGGASSGASARSSTPSAKARVRGLATTLATIGMSWPATFSKKRIGQRRRRSYSSTTAITSCSIETGSAIRTTSPGDARRDAATKLRGSRLTRADP